MGVDEDTAAIITGGRVLEVAGRGSVFVVDGGARSANAARGHAYVADAGVGARRPHAARGPGSTWSRHGCSTSATDRGRAGSVAAVERRREVDPVAGRWPAGWPPRAPTTRSCSATRDGAERRRTGENDDRMSDRAAPDGRRTPT